MSQHLLFNYTLLLSPWPTQYSSSLPSLWPAFPQPSQICKIYPWLYLFHRAKVTEWEHVGVALRFHRLPAGLG
jgi:hypothetical protein